MKLGLIGLPQSGKSTVFEALTGARGEGKSGGGTRADSRIATVTVLDDRVDFLRDLYKPKKTTYAKIEYLLPSELPGSSPSAAEGGVWNQVRPCDGLLHVVRNFKQPGGSTPAPEADFWKVEEGLIVSDLEVAEKRIEKIDLDRKRGKKPEGEERSLLESCCEFLEKGEPLRHSEELASNSLLRGFTFLSSKPVLVIVNNDDEDEQPPLFERWPEGLPFVVVRGRLEMDIASMSAEEAEEFIEAYHIQESALDRVIRASYDLMNRIAFFTVLSDEVRAWTIAKGASALEAAGTVHTDMKKGFIRAETLSFDELKAYGSFQNAKKAGAVRLEGKEYEVKDGDIIHFRFNV